MTLTEVLFLKRFRSMDHDKVRIFFYRTQEHNVNAQSTMKRFDRANNAPIIPRAKGTSFIQGAPLRRYASSSVRFRCNNKIMSCNTLYLVTIGGVGDLSVLPRSIRNPMCMLWGLTSDVLNRACFNPSLGLLLCPTCLALPMREH